MSQSVDDELTEISAALAEIAGGNLTRRLPEDPDSPLVPLVQGINAVTAAWRAAELRARRSKKALHSQLATIEKQTAAIRELSTPVIEIWEDTLLVPIVGGLNASRADDIMEIVLDEISGSDARDVIIDITGVHAVDELTAERLMSVINASRLLGARCVLTGVGASVARTLATQGTDLSGVTVSNTLKSGLEFCLRER